MLSPIRFILLSCFFILSLSVNSQTIKIPKDQTRPLLYLDGKEISPSEMQSINPDDIAAITVLKEISATTQYGEKGKNGVMLIQTRKACRLQFQSYFQTKSEEYKKALLKQGSDQNFVYILNGKVLTDHFEGDLASIADSTFTGIRLIDSETLSASYGVKDKALGVLITVKNHGVVEEQVNAEQEFEPAILILSPFKTFASPETDAGINQINSEFQKKVGQTEVDQKQPLNLQRMQQSTNRFLPGLNFFKQITLISQNYLAYRFYERFPKTLILVSDTLASPGIESLARIATHQNMPYVLAFPELRIVKEGKSFAAYLTVQLYEQESNALLIDKEYKGNDLNPGFEFSCKEGSLNCTLNNAISQALGDVITVVAQNNKTLKAEKALAAKRAGYISDIISKEGWNRTLINEVLANDSTISLSKLYHCLYSPGKDKFVGFFQSVVDSKTFNEFQKNNKDRNVRIITGKDIKDKDFLNESPQTYSYIVKGVLVSGRWYYEKDKVTYFNPSRPEAGRLEYLNNLQDWDFFKEGSTEPDQHFWEGKLFERIPDLRKNPDWEKYKLMWDSREKENREYIGMYELVANTLKREKAARENMWKDSLSRAVFGPFYKTFIIGNREQIQVNKPVLKDQLYIYHSDKRAILNPQEINSKGGNSSVRYFVFIPSENQVFEWTYFPPFKKQKGIPENGIMENLNKLTTWNYSYETLDDDNFWNSYVLYKENGEYKYLKK